MDTHPVFFDIVGSAQVFAEIAGLISGFSLTILAFILERGLYTKNASEIRITKLTVFLALSFYTNLVAALSWAMISGIPIPTAQNLQVATVAVTGPIVLAFLTVLIFSLASTAIIFSIGLLLDRSTIPKEASDIFRGIFCVSVLFGILFVYVVTRVLRIETEHITAQPNWIIVFSALTIPIFLSFIIRFANWWSTRLTGSYQILNWAPHLLVSVTKNKFKWLVGIWLLYLGIIGVILIHAFFLERPVHIPREIVVLLLLGWSIIIAWVVAFYPTQTILRHNEENTRNNQNTRPKFGTSNICDLPEFAVYQLSKAKLQEICRKKASEDWIEKRNNRWLIEPEGLRNYLENIQEKSG